MPDPAAQALTEAELSEVLTQPRNALVRQFGTLLGQSQTRLHVTGAAVRALARQARKRGTGARGLRSIMEALLQDSMFEARAPRAPARQLARGAAHLSLRSALCPPSSIWACECFLG